MRNERGETRAGTTEIQRIVRNYYEELYAKKFENLGKMDTFLEKYNLPKLNEGENIKSSKKKGDSYLQRSSHKANS